MDEKDKILPSIKKLLGVNSDYTAFDPDLVVHINSTFSVLTQLGVGPENGFAIAMDGHEAWSDFTDDDNTLNMVKSYMYLKVKQLFDSGSMSSYLLESMERQAKEYEWRLNVIAEQKGKIQNGT